MVHERVSSASRLDPTCRRMSCCHSCSCSRRPGARHLCWLLYKWSKRDSIKSTAVVDGFKIKILWGCAFVSSLNLEPWSHGALVLTSTQRIRLPERRRDSEIELKLRYRRQLFAEGFTIFEGAR